MGGPSMMIELGGGRGVNPENIFTTVAFAHYSSILRQKGLHGLLASKGHFKAIFLAQPRT